MFRAFFAMPQTIEGFTKSDEGSELEFAETAEVTR
jgi:hypothetical protein